MRRHTLTIALVLLLVGATLAAPVGVAAGERSVDDTRSADLVVEQPDYVADDVAERTENGTPLYVAGGERLYIAPQNVDHDNVTDAGLATDAGHFEYHDGLGVYVLEPQGHEGTFDLYWDVRETTTVDDGNETTTETETVRYEALVRVESHTDGVYLGAGEHDELQNQSAIGEHAEGIVADLESRWLPFFDTSGDTETVLERMGTLAATLGNPLNIFEEGYIGFHTFVVLSIGGTLAALQYLGFFAWVVRKLRREKHEFEVAEAHEGDLAQKELRVEERERLNKLANMDWFDIFEDDHVARAFRDQFGETVLDGWTRLNSLILPEHLVRDRVKAMGHAGYVAVGAFDGPISPSEPQGESDEDTDPVPSLEAVRLVREDDLEHEGLGERELAMTLPDPSNAPVDLETIVDRLDWNDPELVAFDFADAGVDPQAIETSVDTLDLERVVEQLDTQMQHFDDEQQYGQYLCEFVEHVREHPFTDDDGTPDDLRYAFNNLLQAAQLLDDRFGYPLSAYQVDAFDGALETYDRSARAAAYSEEVSHGAA